MAVPLALLINEADLSELPQTSALSDVDFDGGFIMAVPLMMRNSPQFAGRGQSIYDGKSGNFDALDEAYSQWWQALRDSR